MRPGPQHIGTTSAVSGNVLTYDAVLDEYRPMAIPATGVQSVVAGQNVTVVSTDPLHPIVKAWALLTSKTSAGDATLVWGGADDDELIYVEGP